MSSGVDRHATEPARCLVIRRAVPRLESAADLDVTPPCFHTNPQIVYKRYASLFFIACVDRTDNELITLEQIHLFVEILDRCAPLHKSILRAMPV